MTEPNPPESPSAVALRAAFDGTSPYTVGIEDELMLLDPGTFELAPRAAEVLAEVGGDGRFKLELPASQLEIVTPVCASVADAAAALLDARRALAARTEGLVRLASAGVHPFSSGAGALNRLPQYEHTIRHFGALAHRQLVCALQVHVSIPDADRALAVYNAARSYLPWLAALAANAPFYEGRDTGLASVRPMLGQLLPRQGTPPPIASWEAYAETLRWGAAAGAFPDARTWWWELRLHRRFGTIEFRVPDGQSTVADAAALAALAQALTAWLGQRHAAGEQLPVAPSWKIDENRWSACRYGVEGTMADLNTGQPRATRACLEELLEILEPVASALGASAPLGHAAELARQNGAIAQRLVAAEAGVEGVARWLAERFPAPSAG